VIVEPTKSVPPEPYTVRQADAHRRYDLVLPSKQPTVSETAVGLVRGQVAGEDPEPAAKVLTS
jgi:hypothetical protein